jgi:hypothetical protein
VTGDNPKDMVYWWCLCSICCTDIDGMYTISHSGNAIVTVIHTDFPPVYRVFWGICAYNLNEGVLHLLNITMVWLFDRLSWFSLAGTPNALATSIMLVLQIGFLFMFFHAIFTMIDYPNGHCLAVEKWVSEGGCQAAGCCRCWRRSWRESAIFVTLTHASDRVCEPPASRDRCPSFRLCVCERPFIKIISSWSHDTGKTPLSITAYYEFVEIRISIPRRFCHLMASVPR